MLDTLVSTTSPNDGVLNTIGSLGVDTNDLLGFDIFTEGGLNTAYALLNTGGGVNQQVQAAAVDGTPGLCRIDLLTGQATLIGAVNGQGLFSLAVAPAVVPAPVPLALLGIAGLAGIAARRRVSGSTSAHCR